MCVVRVATVYSTHTVVLSLNLTLIYIMCTDLRRTNCTQAYCISSVAVV
jgi:hypothetical protein